jgi:OOP family OmpA-OmpF porin
MKLRFLLAATLTFAAINLAHADETGFYLRGALGQAHTTLDTSNTVHATYITGDDVNKLSIEIGGGYRFNQYVGAELSYVDFGKPRYDLTRGTTGETSVMTVKNTGVVAAVRGFYPINDKFTLTGRVGAVFVHTSLDRKSDSPDDAYTGKDNQVHSTIGIGGTYKLTDKLSLTGDLNWYPNITKTNDNATDTNARMASVGLQYNF